MTTVSVSDGARWVVDFSESTVVAPKGSTAYPHLSTASQCIDRRVSVIVAYILAQVFLTGFIVFELGLVEDWWFSFTVHGHAVSVAPTCNQRNMMGSS